MDKSYIPMLSIVALLGGALIWSLFSWISNGQAIAGHSQDRYEQAISDQDKIDPCQTPAGYTDQKWREHMGHHPDQYKDCL